jgi:hypothetical protein
LARHVQQSCVRIVRMIAATIGEVKSDRGDCRAGIYRRTSPNLRVRRETGKE